MSSVLFWEFGSAGGLVPRFHPRLCRGPTARTHPNRVGDRDRSSGHSRRGRIPHPTRGGVSDQNRPFVRISLCLMTIQSGPCKWEIS